MNPRVLGFVLDEDRGPLPYALVHGEALVACAAWALGKAGVRLFDASVPWTDLVAVGEPLVLHDSLCPMTPPEFIAWCLRLSLAQDAVVVGVRPVTDTIKTISRAAIGANVDRDGLRALVSPVVLPARVVASMSSRPTSNLVDLVAELAMRENVVPAQAPAEAGRVTTRRGPASARSAHRWLSSRSANATSSAKVIFRFVAALATAVMSLAPLWASTAAVSVPSNPVRASHDVLLAGCGRGMPLVLDGARLGSWPLELGGHQRRCRHYRDRGTMLVGLRGRRPR